MIRCAALLVACACASAPSPCPTVPSAPGAPPLLWRVEGPGGGAIWLYGTVHDTGADDVPPAVWPRLDAATVFVSELGDEEPDAEAMNALARLPWGQVLDRLLPADDWWDLVEAMLGAMTEDELRHARPWFALVRLHTRLVHAPRPSMDAALAEHARARGIAVERLESWQEQLSALDASVTPADLSRAIRGRRAVACQVAQLHAAYRSSDLAALARILVEPLRGAPLLAERNRRWLPQIERLVARGDGFVAVGLGHLLGESGLTTMLARAGYRVVRAP